MPLASKSLGYMLIDVNPGIVFISFKYISPRSETRKSTLESPLQSQALYAFTASLLIKSSFSVPDGINSFDSLLEYFAS